MGGRRNCHKPQYIRVSVIKSQNYLTETLLPRVNVMNKIFMSGVVLICSIVVFNGCNNQSVNIGKSIIGEKIEVVAQKPTKNIVEETTANISDDVVGFWQFNDTTNKVKDSSKFNNDLIANGNLIFTNGTVYMHGGTVKLPRKEQDFLYSKSTDFDLGTESFTVECWFKSSIIGYHKFAGTRNTIRPGYTSQNGWALGLSAGDGKIMFVVNDKNNNKSYAGINIGESSWDGDEWNYYVGVRDITTKKIRLYINGKLATAVDDTCGDITRSSAFTIGYDGYTGALTEGAFGYVKITKGIVSEDTISNEYTRVMPPISDVEKIIVKDDTSIPENINIDLADGLDGKLNLQPLPVSLKYSRRYRELKQPVYIQLPATVSNQQRIAEKIIISDLGSHLNIKVVKISADKRIDSGTVIKLSRSDSADAPESYRLAIDKKSRVITISSIDHGIIYGALTLMQIIEQATLIEKGVVSLPDSLAIYDYPAVARRIQVRLLSRNLADSDASIARVMMRIARTRYNYYTVNPLDSNPSAENIKRLVKVADKYGVKVMTTVSYAGASRALKRALTIDDMHNIVFKKIVDAIDAGCTGVSFHFDDLGQYKKLASDFPGGVGAFQRQFLTEVQKLAKQKGIDFLSTCPTMYMRDWQNGARNWFGSEDKYANYFEEISHLPGGDIELFYTDIADIPDIRKRGVRRPAYYLNGVWNTQRMLGTYAGPNRLMWSWYGFDVDPVKGPILDTETMAAWKNIAKDEIESVWVGAGGLGGPIIAGIWMWNPAAFNENEAVKEVNRQVAFGAGTFDALLNYEKNILPLVALFKTYVNAATSEFHVKTLDRQHPLNVDDLTAYWTNYQEAEKAYKTIQEIIAETDGKVYRSPAYKNDIKEMYKTLGLFRDKLIKKMEIKGLQVIK